MNSTTTRIATALAGAAAIIGAGWGAATASQPAVDQCAVAVSHADRMAHLQPRMNVTQGLLGIAMAERNNREANQRRTQLRALQTTYFAVQADYLAASKRCDH